MATYNEQLQQLHAKAAAAAKSGAGASSLATDPLVAFQAKQGGISVPKPTPNPAATDVAKPVTKPAPKPAPAPTPAPTPAPAPAPAPPPPASTGVSGPSSQAEVAQAAKPATPDIQAQIDAARKAYLGTLAPSADVTAATSALGDVASQTAQQEAAAQKQYADRIAAIQGQATLQPFLTGREQQAQQQLTNQLAAIKSGSEAETLPLQARLAQFQAAQKAQQEQAQAALGFATPPTSAVQPGETIINPVTGQPVFTAPSKPITVAPGTQLVDPNTGRVISSTPAKPMNVSATGTLIDPTTGKVIAQGAGASLGGLSPSAIDTAAQQYLLTGQMPTLGIGGATAKVAILNRAADLASANGQDAQALALQKAAFKSGQSELTKLMGQQGPVMAFENTAKANLDQALNLSNEVDRSGSPVVNRWLLKLQGQYAGDPQVAQFEASVETAANEYAKVVSSATGGGVSTDSARSQANSLLNSAQTPEQFAAVVQQLKVEMENRRTGMDQEIQNIQDQMLGNTAKPGGAYISADGTQYEQGADGLYYPKAEGGTGAAGQTSVKIPETSHLAFVNNNPGNLRFANQPGATMGEKGFAKFNSPEEGYAALKRQVSLDASQGLTLQQFVTKYAPPSENDTVQYLRQIMGLTGANADTPISDIDQDALAQALAQKESSTIIG